MSKHVKIFVLFFIFIFEFSVDAKNMLCPDYEKYVNDIISIFTKEMNTKFKLHCEGSGGRMPNDVEEIDVSFITFQHLTIDEAREIGVYSVRSLLNRINSFDKIRPFLREYPFTINRIKISISIRDKNDNYEIDGSVVRIYLSNSKIYYSSAEIQIKKPTPLTYVNENNEIVREFRGGEPEVVTIPLLEETYEDALKILGQSTCE